MNREASATTSAASAPEMLGAVAMHGDQIGLWKGVGFATIVAAMFAAVAAAVSTKRSAVRTGSVLAAAAKSVAATVAEAVLTSLPAENDLPNKLPTGHWLVCSEYLHCPTLARTQRGLVQWSWRSKAN